MKALAGSPSLLVILALWRRSLYEILRVRGALLPATIAPVVFLLGMSGQFGRLTGLDGFPTDSYLSWVVPPLQQRRHGCEPGAPAGRDRFLVALVPRAVLLVGPILGAVAPPPRWSWSSGWRADSLAASPGSSPSTWPRWRLAPSRAWGIFMAVTFKTQQAGPLMAVFLSTATSSTWAVRPVAHTLGGPRAAVPRLVGLRRMGR